LGAGTNSTNASLQFRAIFTVSSSAFIYTALRTTDPGAGSKEFWCDTGAANVVKYRP
jgi:hypothetical protein